MVAPAIAGGALALALAVAHWRPHWSGSTLAEAGVLAVGVFAGELLPITIPRREGDEQVTFSTTFAFALAVLVGFAPAAICMCVASVIQDGLSRKPWWRVLFNVGQYSLSLGAASLAMHFLAGLPHLHGQAFRDSDLPAIAVGALLFFSVNYCIVGTTVALYTGARPLRYLRRELGFTTLTGAVVLAMAPIMLAAIAFAPLMFPLLAFPLLAIYRGSKQAGEREHAATRDSLTGLLNRAAFQETVGLMLDDEATHQAAVMLMDLNRFKEINDTLGHHYGDQLLTEVAARLRGVVREEEVFARLGGDEFALALAGVPSAPVLQSIAARLLDALEAPFEFDGITLEIGASIGGACYPAHGRNVEELLQRADVAMYHAKDAHEGYAGYTPDLDQHSPARLALSADLRAAIDEHQLELHYQPKVDARTQELLGVEGLARWRHPALGELRPDAFVPLAEHTGLIRAMTLEVISIALRQHIAWSRIGLDVPVAVNVSARSLLDRRFPAQVERALADHAVDPHALTLEVTESMIMADPHLAAASLGELSELGVTISIDDFGTGYSSLSYLTQLPATEVKLDRSFVQRMGASHINAAVVKSVIELGDQLGLRVVAEGVEDETTLRELVALGCDAIQGYHIAHPLRPDDLLEWLRLRRPADELPPLPPLLTDVSWRDGAA